MEGNCNPALIVIPRLPTFKFYRFVANPKSETVCRIHLHDGLYRSRCQDHSPPQPLEGVNWFGELSDLALIYYIYIYSFARASSY